MKTICGAVAVLLGVLATTVVVNHAGQPMQAPFSFNLNDAVSTYLFSFAWTGGFLGMAVGILLMIAYLALWFFLGVWLCKTVSKVRAARSRAPRP